jgi:hypothetical protein
MRAGLKASAVEYLVTTSISENGQLTVPKQFRQDLGLDTGALTPADAHQIIGDYRHLIALTQPEVVPYPERDRVRSNRHLIRHLAGSCDRSYGSSSSDHSWRRRASSATRRFSCGPAQGRTQSLDLQRLDDTRR